MELFGTEAGAKLHPLMAYRCDDNQEEDILNEYSNRRDNNRSMGFFHPLKSNRPQSSGR